MIAGIGIDIIEIDRIKQALCHPKFISRVFTQQEQRYCDSRGVQRAASYAARFAGKEAVLKALGTGLVGGRWQDIQILPNEQGQPVVSLTGAFGDIAAQQGVQQIFISLSHARDYAAAQVIFWGGNDNESSNSSRDARN